MPLNFYRTEFPPEIREKIFADNKYAYMEPYRVAPHVWMVSGHMDQSDFLIDTGDGLILIDTPVPDFEYALLDSIKKVGYDPKDIKILLLTHEHGDHDGCARTIKELSGCKIYMSKESWHEKQHPVQRPARPAAVGMPKPLAPSPAYEPDEFYSDDKSITLGRFTIRSLLTPGHTPGVTSFFFDDTDDETGITYHVGMHGGLGIDAMRPDRCGIEPWGATLENRDRYIDQCWELSLMDIDITLASHSNQANYNANIPADRNDYTAFVEPRAWLMMLMERRSRVMEFRAGANTYYGDEKRM